MAEFVERRHSPRVVRPSEPCRVLLNVHSSARIVDVSESGMLLASSVGIPVGSRARLRTMLGTDQFETEVEVRQNKPMPQEDTSRRALGVTFVAPEPQTQLVLRRLLKP